MHELEAWELRAGHRTRRRRPEDSEALTWSASALLANLYAAARNVVTRDLFLAVGFSNGEYVQRDRYKRSPVSLSAMKALRIFGTARGWIEFHPGFHASKAASGAAPGADIGRLSRMRAGPALVAWLEERGVTLDAIGSSGARELVHLRGPARYRGGPKPLLDYKDTPVTIEWRTALKEINEVLSRTEVRLSGVPNGADEWSAVADVDDDEDEEHHNGNRWEGGDLTAKTLVRKFNDGRWEHGGRLYGGWWEGASKAVRKRITIDGEPTVELDFKALHPRILYDREGLPAPLEPYVVPGLEGVPRGVGKVAFMRLVNKSTPGMPRTRQKDREAMPRGVTFEDFLSEFTTYHAPILHHFGTGVGVKLQRMDSDVAITVLDSLTRVRGIPVLPVHDSFIVQARYEDDLRKEMVSAYRSRCGGLEDAPIGYVL